MGFNRNWAKQVRTSDLPIRAIVPKEEWEKGAEDLSEDLMARNFPEGKKQTSKSRKPKELQMRWIQRGPHQDTLKLKCQKLKIEKNLKAAREKQLAVYKEKPVSREIWAETV